MDRKNSFVFINLYKFKVLNFILGDNGSWLSSGVTYSYAKGNIRNVRIDLVLVLSLQSLSNKVMQLEVIIVL